jgi:hypothetical protein
MAAKVYKKEQLPKQNRKKRKKTLLFFFNVKKYAYLCRADNKLQLLRFI